MLDQCVVSNLEAGWLDMICLPPEDWLNVNNENKKKDAVISEAAVTLEGSQISSKTRVIDYGEVYTGHREVNAMLGLVKRERERIDSRFPAPACGTGNFLDGILKRKLGVVESRYSKSQLDYERNAVLAVSSLYGLDILQDNVAKCRDRLFDLFNEACTDLHGTQSKDEYRK